MSASFADSRFRELWAANGLSSVGDGVVLVALPLLALRSSGHPLAVAGVFVAGRLPGVLLALPAGALADRVDRRKLLIGINLTRGALAAVLAVLLLNGITGLALIYGAALVFGALGTAFALTMTASVPELVPPTDLLRANARLMNAELIGEQTVGPALGGAAVAAARAVPFLADAAGFTVAAVLLRRPIASPTPLGPESRRGLVQEMTEGLRWFIRHRRLRALSLVVATFAFCQAGVYGVLPLFARKELHVSSSGYGLLMALAGLGDVIGAMVATRIHARIGTTAMVVGGGLVAASCYPIVAATHSALTAAAALALEGVAVVVGNVASRTIRQSMVPLEMQGRAASAYQVMILAMLPLGAAAGGAVAAGIGIRHLIFGAAILQLLVLVILGWRIRGHGADAPSETEALVEPTAGDAPNTLAPPADANPVAP